MAPDKRYGLTRPPIASALLLADLNPEQRRAVDAEARRILILAGAGTGKTRTLTARVARLVERGTKPEAIVLATFTKRAAEEMIGRVEGLLGGAARRVRAGTFHALAYRFLKERRGTAPIVLDPDDQGELMGRVIAGLELAGPFPSAELVLGVLSFALNTGRSLADALIQRAPEHARALDLLEEAVRRYAAQKSELGACDYDDLLLEWRAALASSEGALIRGPIEHVLVDEFQDTNLLQAEIAELLAQDRALCVVGDDAQSIYAFRGARFENILELPRRSPTEVHSLTLNYRSDPNILALANASIAKNPLQFPKLLSSTRPARALPVRIAAKDAAEEASFVAQRVAELRDEGVPLSAQAVLLRAHGHALEIELALVRRGLPYLVRAGARFLEQAHVRDLIAVLRVVARPTDRLAWARILRMLPGAGSRSREKIEVALRAGAEQPLASLRALSESAALPARAQNSLRRLVAALEPWLAQRPAPSPATIAHALLDENSDPVGLLAYVRGAHDRAEQRIEELRTLATLAEREAELEPFLAELALEQDLSGVADGPGRPGAERLTLSTIHQAKGLEWRAVFVVGLCEGGFPSRQSSFEPDGEAEERRLFYVAVTRAKEQLYLCQPSMRRAGEHDTIILRASRFLEELDPALYERWALDP